MLVRLQVQIENSYSATFLKNTVPKSLIETRGTNKGLSHHVILGTSQQGNHGPFSWLHLDFEAIMEKQCKCTIYVNERA